MGLNATKWFAPNAARQIMLIRSLASTQPHKGFVESPSNQSTLTAQRFETIMNQLSIQDILKRLGYFHIATEDRGTSIDFLVGHVSPPPFIALSLNKETGVISGPYAELIPRLTSVISRYQKEGDEIIMLPQNVRQAWIAELAQEAELTTQELQMVTAGIR